MSKPCFPFCLKIVLILIFVWGVAAFALAKEQKPVRILFIGNSYSFFNDLPNMLMEVAKTKDIRLDVATAAYGGWTLQQHAHSKQTLNILNKMKWDYVVLQEQSVIPSIRGTREKKMYPAARKLVQIIRRNGAKPVFFMTWGRRHGLREQGFDSYSAMQRQITQGYETIARELKVRIAPVGIAWKKARMDAPLLDFWIEDGSHPNKEGSYLAACVFYATIFQDSPEGTGDLYNIGKTKAEYLQKVAAETVLTNPEKWNIR